MPYRKLLLSYFLAMLSIVSSAPLWAHDSHKPAYIKDEKGRTLIFRSRTDARIIVAPFVAALGLWGLYHTIFSKVNSKGILISGKERAVMGGLSTLFSGIGIGALYLEAYNYYRMDKPLIILDEQGLWYESWKHAILWTEIEHITLVKVNQREYDDRGNDYDRGYFWKIELKTNKQKTFTIDERSTSIGESNRRGNFSDNNAGGELGQLILQYHSKYKSEKKV